MKEKTLAEKLREQLAYNPKHGGLKLTEDQLRRAYEFCDDYKEFLDNAKTEREAVAESVRLAEIAGFVPFEKGKVYTAGQKVYRVNRGKAIMLVKDQLTEDQLTFAENATFLIFGTGGIIAAVAERIGVTVLRLDGTFLSTLAVDNGAIRIA